MHSPSKEPSLHIKYVDVFNLITVVFNKSIDDPEVALFQANLDNILHFVHASDNHVSYDNLDHGERCACYPEFMLIPIAYWNRTVLM